MNCMHDEIEAFENRVRYGCAPCLEVAGWLRVKMEDLVHDLPFAVHL